MSARWITIGAVRDNWYVHRLNCGWPGGLLIYWRGRYTFGQPHDFLTWGELLWAVRRRCELARLEPIAIRSAARRDVYGLIILQVLVRRRLTGRPCSVVLNEAARETEKPVLQTLFQARAGFGGIDDLEQRRH